MTTDSDQRSGLAMIGVLVWVCVCDPRAVGQSCEPGWSGLAGGMSDGAGSPEVFSLATFEDAFGQALFAGGYYKFAGGVPARNIARWGGASWYPLGGGSGWSVTALKSADLDGLGGSAPRLAVAGGLFPIPGSPLDAVAWWTGTQWQPLARRPISRALSSPLKSWSLTREVLRLHVCSPLEPSLDS
jgi:hypothetical protein